MRIILISLLISSQFTSLSAQEITPDSVDTVYAPLDSLDAGLDLALNALKMKRGDLTFRGDYLEPDMYRIDKIDAFMLNPLRLVNSAETLLRKPHQFAFQGTGWS